MKRTAPESQVVSACIRWLWFNGCFVWRNNTGGWRVPNTKRVIRYGFPGSGDIIGVNPHGRFISIECKSPDGNDPTPIQERFGSRVIENSGIYIVARSVDDLEAHKVEILSKITYCPAALAEDALRDHRVRPTGRRTRSVEESINP